MSLVRAFYWLGTAMIASAAIALMIGALALIGIIAGARLAGRHMSLALACMNNRRAPAAVALAPGARSAGRRSASSGGRSVAIPRPLAPAPASLFLCPRPSRSIRDTRRRGWPNWPGSGGRIAVAVAPAVTPAVTAKPLNRTRERGRVTALPARGASLHAGTHTRAPLSLYF